MAEIHRRTGILIDGIDVHPCFMECARFPYRWYGLSEFFTGRKDGIFLQWLWNRRKTIFLNRWRVSEFFTICIRTGKTSNTGLRNINDLQNWNMNCIVSFAASVISSSMTLLLLSYCRGASKFPLRSGILIFQDWIEQRRLPSCRMN